MTNSYADLKKSSIDALADLQKKAEREANNSSNRQTDDRFWQPKTNKDGTGFAVIRFLPQAPGDEDELCWVRVYSHGFKGPTGRWYINNSLTTIGKKDPCGEYNSQLWNSGSDANKEQAREQKRRVSYYSNILVVKDPANPENEGKVFLFRYGVKIWDKLSAKMTPDPEFGDEPLNPFDMENGANFRLKMKKVSGFRNYDDSEFENPSAVGKNDKEREKIWRQEYSLQEFLDPTNFKSFKELRDELEDVLGHPPTLDEVTPKKKANGRSKTKEEKTLADTLEETEADIDIDLGENEEFSEDQYSKLLED